MRGYFWWWHDRSGSSKTDDEDASEDRFTNLPHEEHCAAC
jgi:hypothetical protein